MILGNLYREKGQVGRAIQVHQTLLQRPKLKRLEHAYVLLCLGLDYKRGGFVDRALEAFNEVLRLDPENEYALLNLEKLHEEQHQWPEAYDDPPAPRASWPASESPPQSQAILAFLENELGLEGARRRRLRARRPRFQAAIDLDARAVPAYLESRRRARRSGRGGGGGGDWERRSRSRRTAPTWRSTGSKRPTPRSAPRTAFPRCAGG